MLVLLIAIITAACALALSAPSHNDAHKMHSGSNALISIALSSGFSESRIFLATSSDTHYVQRLILQGYRCPLLELLSTRQVNFATVRSARDT